MELFKFGYCCCYCYFSRYYIVIVRHRNSGKMGQLNERQKLIVSSVVMFIIVILVNLKCIKVSLFDVVD